VPIALPASDAPGARLQPDLVLLDLLLPRRNGFEAKAHSFADYAVWHLGLTEGADDETKARYAFVYGDFRRAHRALIGRQRADSSSRTAALSASSGKHDLGSTAR
jgi:hypothetical protein